MVNLEVASHEKQTVLIELEIKFSLCFLWVRLFESSSVLCSESVGCFTSYLKCFVSFLIMTEEALPRMDNSSTTESLHRRFTLYNIDMNFSSLPL